MSSITQGTQTVGRDQELSQLTEEISKLTNLQTTFQTRLEAESSPTEVEASSLSKKSEYDSCEELEMINGAERLEREQSQELSSLSAKLREMEAKWEELYQQHQEVTEERCELEEAENDSRLRAQK